MSRGKKAELMKSGIREKGEVVLKKHLRTSRVSRRKTPHWPCYYCQQKSSSYPRLRRHYLEVHKEPWIGCSACRISLPDKEERERHLETCPHAVSCDFCLTMFDMKLRLQTHLLHKHLGVVRPKEKRECIACYVCGKLLKKKSIQKHIDIYHSEFVDATFKEFKCNRCSFRTNIPKTLERHEKRHSARFYCDLCGKSFHAEWYLLSHQNVHTGSRPFQCTFCDKRFTRKPYLISHLKIHAKQNSLTMKSVLCKICFGRFTVESFDVHALSCTGPLPLPFGDFSQS